MASIGKPSRDLDAELAQLVSDPDSIGFRPLPIRQARKPRRPRTRQRRRSRIPLPSAIFLNILAVAFAGGALAATQSYTTTSAGVGVFVFILAAWLVSVCLHEFAHALAAHRGGDHGIEEAGYLTLNPLRYAHPFLSVVLPLFWIAYGGIGLPGGAVLVHRHRLSRRWASVMSAVGPLVNVALAVLAISSLHLFHGAATWGGPGFALYAAIGWFAWLQLAVAILNLLPIPGLDGWGIIDPWLSPATAHSAAKIAPFGVILVMGLLVTPTCSAEFSHIVTQVASWLGAPPFLPSMGADLFRFWRR